MRDGDEGEGGIWDEWRGLEDQRKAVPYSSGERNRKRSGIWVQSNPFSSVAVEVEEVSGYVGREILEAVFATYNSLFAAYWEHEDKLNTGCCKEFLVT